MIRFTKTAVVAGGHSAEALGFADKVTQLMNSRYPDARVQWGMQIGGASGVVHWTMDVEDLNTVGTMFRELMMDGEYTSLVDSAGQAFVHGSVHDTLVSLVG
jgi:hypothetical protein